MLTLRPDQKRVTDQVDALLALGRRPIYTVGTGAGKGVVIVHYLTKYASERRHVLMCVHRIELLRDTAERVRQATGLPVRMLAGNEPEGDADSFITIVSLPTMVARELVLPAELVLVDECHVTGAASFQAALVRYGCPWLGFSATPQRDDGVGLGGVGWTDLVVGPQIQELVDMGVLADVDLYSASKETNTLSEDPVEAWKRYAGDRPGIVFAASLKHSRELAARFSAAGYLAAHVDGETASAERKSVLARFEAGELNIICCKRLLKEGINVVRAKAVMLASKYSTTGAYLQSIGRARRRTPDGTRAVLIDLHANFKVHGHPNDDREYSLEGRAIKASGKSQCRQCVMCYRWGTETRCPCGMLMPPAPLPRVSKKELKLIAQERALLRRNPVDWALWQRLCKEQVTKNYKPQYAFLTFKRLVGRSPRWSVEMGLNAE